MHIPELILRERDGGGRDEHRVTPERHRRLKIRGWLVKPPDFDPSKKYPLILDIHGGPHAMYNTGFSFARQDHAAHGYLVLYTNPRGSTGHGSAFGNATKNAYPGKDFDDLMAGVDTANRSWLGGPEEAVRLRVQRWRRAHGVDCRTYEPVRRRVVQLPRDQLVELCRHDGRRELVLQL